MKSTKIFAVLFLSMSISGSAFAQEQSSMYEGELLEYSSGNFAFVLPDAWTDMVVNENGKVEYNADGLSVFVQVDAGTITDDNAYQEYMDSIDPKMYCLENYSIIESERFGSYLKADYSFVLEFVTYKAHLIALIDNTDFIMIGWVNPAQDDEYNKADREAFQNYISINGCSIASKPFSVDLNLASDQELDDTIEIIKAEQAARVKEQIPEAEPLSKDMIAFRDVPWYSSRKETEEIIGFSSNSEGPDDIYRLAATNFANVTSGSDRVDELGGCRAYYSGVSVAGYTPSSTYICYIYPIVDDMIIRDDEQAQMYFGYYTFEHGDFGDYEAIYTDLASKLVSVYGEGTEISDEFRTTNTWKDSYGYGTFAYKC